MICTCLFYKVQLFGVLLFSSYIRPSTDTLNTYNRLVSSGHLPKSVPNKRQAFPPIGGLGFAKNQKESAIKDSVDNLQLALDQVSTLFYKVVALRGSELMVQDIRVQSCNSIKDLNVAEMRKAINDGLVSFKDLEASVYQIETLLHFLLEDSRDRLRNINTELFDLGSKRELMNSKIENLEETITNLEALAREKEDSSWYFGEQAKTNERESESSMLWGLGQLAVGGALTYLTAGGYLMYAGVGTAVRGVLNMAKSENLSRRAEELRREASRHTNQANAHRHETGQLRLEIKNIEIDITQNKLARQELSSSVKQLENLLDSIHSSTRSTTEVLEILGNMYAALKDAGLHSRSLKFFQNTHSNLSSKLRRASKAQEEGMKRAWKTIEQIVLIKHRLVAG